MNYFRLFSNITKVQQFNSITIGIKLGIGLGFSSLKNCFENLTVIVLIQLCILFENLVVMDILKKKG